MAVLQFSVGFTAADSTGWHCGCVPSSDCKSRGTTSTSGGRLREGERQLLERSSGLWDRLATKRSCRRPELWLNIVRQPIWMHRECKSLKVHFQPSALDAQLPSGLDRLRGPLSVESELVSLCRQGQLDKAFDSLYCMDEQGVVPSVELYRALLSACAKRKALAQAKRVHLHLAQFGLESGCLGEYVVITLVKCGNLEGALQVFYKLPHRTVMSWTAVISGCTKAGQGKKALKLYQWMRGEGVQPNEFTFGSLLKACSSLGDIVAGKYIHAEALKFRCGSNLFVCTSLVDMYSKCGSIADAESVFHALPQPDIVAWTAMLSAYVQQALSEKALQLYCQMSEEGLILDAWIFAGALQACSMLAEKNILMQPLALQKGRAIHAEAWRRGHSSDAFVCSSLISMYEKSGSVADAQNVFDGLLQPDVVLWNAMLTAHAQHGRAGEALQLYGQMLEEGVRPNDRSFVSVLQACSTIARNDEDRVTDGESIKVECLQRGRNIHAEAWRTGYASDVFVGHALITMYGKCGSIMDAQNLFRTLPQQDVVSWTALLAAYTQQGIADTTLELYGQMLQDGLSPDDRSLVCALQTCAMLAEQEDEASVAGQLIKVQSVEKGKAIHAEVWKRGYTHNVFVGSSLVSMYGKCGSIVEAQDVFKGLCMRDVVSWNAMLAAYAQQGEVQAALHLYGQMLEEGASPDDRSFVSSLQACGTLAESEGSHVVEGRSLKVEALGKGREIHAEAWKRGYKSDAFVCNTLVSIYGKCGSIADALNVFDESVERDVVMWNAMLGVYAQQGEAEAAWRLYQEMQDKGVTPDDVTYLCILQACSTTGSLNICMQIHCTFLSSESNFTPLAASGLIHAYGRCASMEEAQRVFDELSAPDMVSWNALIAGYARQGDCERSLQWYEKMVCAGIKPDGITFLSLLSACSHAGMVDKGVEYFVSMSRDYGIVPDVLHYVSMVDLLGRGGYFKLVEELLETMPMQPSLSMWLCLLNACRKHGNVVLGEHAFECAVSLQPHHASAYVLMSNIYTHAGMWECAMKVAEQRQKAGAWKMVGESRIEHEQKVHGFVVGDHKHQQQEQIYDLLQHFST